ncbi:response regulator transcription factor [Patescibacteria group bacterium]|nr:response regulator transcription factor [Patescibacteria group bacterium]
MQNILLVENDKTLSKMISDYFINKNFECNTCSSVDSACNLIEEKDFDLVILDRILDDGDGIEVAEFINDFNFKTRIIMLSQKSKTEDKIAGFEVGADDYLSKPFAISELSLRVNSLLSKHKLKISNSFSLGPITIFPKTGEVIFHGVTSTMRKKEIQILACLFKHKNHVVNRNMIINDVWSGGSEIPTHTTLDVYIRRIRIFLGDNKNIIKTVRGFGYMASLAE